MSETISPDTTIAQYNVIVKIGEGGMGEVYRARDTKLARDVPLFDSHVDSYTATNRYAVSRDGRFLINQAIEERISTPMTVVVNWLVKK